jgi:HAMP domain-containing protein
MAHQARGAGRQLQQYLFRLEEEFVILTEVRNSYNRILDVFYNLNHEFEKGGKRNEEYIQILTGQPAHRVADDGLGHVPLQELIRRASPARSSTPACSSCPCGRAGLVIAANSILSGRSINNSIQRLHDGHQHCEYGKLDYKVGTDRQDEIGQLSRSFDHMTRNCGR